MSISLKPGSKPRLGPAALLTGHETQLESTLLPPYLLNSKTPSFSLSSPTPASKETGKCKDSKWTPSLVIEVALGKLLVLTVQIILVSLRRLDTEVELQ